MQTYTFRCQSSSLKAESACKPAEIDQSFTSISEADFCAPKLALFADIGNEVDAIGSHLLPDKQ